MTETDPRTPAVPPLFLDAFASLHPDVFDPDAARDTCIQVSDEFALVLNASGIAAEPISGMEMGEVSFFPGQQVVLGAHVAVQVGDVVYDWTARQFDDGADVPLVLGVEEWVGRWKPIGPQA